MGTALGLFLAARLLGCAAVALVARGTGGQPVTVLLGRSWDSLWYLRIAEEGYGQTLRPYPGLVQSDLAFFPLYPGLLRAVTELTPLGGTGAGLLVSWTAAGVAACGIHAIGVRLHDRAVATALVLLWGLLPHSVVLSMAYTEPVLTAFAAWALYAVLTGRWLWAGALAACAGLARPNGFAVAVAVLAAAAYECCRQHRGEVAHRVWAGAVLAPLGWAAYVLWVGRRRGDPLGGYFEVQRQWGSRFDFGLDALRSVRRLLLEGGPLVLPVSLATVAAALLLYGLLAADRAPLPLLVYAGVLLAVAAGGAGFFQCKPRFLLPAFPLLLPLACALARTARARPWHATLVVGALAGLSFAYGAYLVVLADRPL
nr:mannosyltransferase family protein [Streptomyces sp. REN17]